jgi:hypothetical protein
MSGYTIEQASACHAGTIVTQIDRDVERGRRVRANLGNVFLKGCGRTVNPARPLPSKHLGCVNDRTHSHRRRTSDDHQSALRRAATVASQTRLIAVRLAIHNRGLCPPKAVGRLLFGVRYRIPRPSSFLARPG